MAPAHPDELRASLCERLAFERLAVRVYDAAIGKLESAPEALAPEELVRSLRAFREEEGANAAWLEERLRELGHDPAGPEQAALGASLEALGICTVILAPEESLARTFHALLGFEILDAAGWRHLVQLAEAAGSEEARLAACVRLWAEEEHAELAAAIVRTLAHAELLAERPVSRAA